MSIFTGGGHIISSSYTPPCLSISLSFFLSSSLSLSPQSQLDAMHLNKLHAATMAPAPAHIKGKEDKDVRSHPRARRVSSDENSRRSNIPASGITPIPELTESFERRLRFRNQKVMSLVNISDHACITHHFKGLHTLRVCFASFTVWPYSSRLMV